MTEKAVVFGRNHSLVGLLTEPVGQPLRGPSVVILNAGIIHRVGPSRLYVHLARTIAEAGYRVLRFDLSGIGDSRRASEDGTLADIVSRDIRDAIDLVTQNRPEPGAVLMGVCSGADNSFIAGAKDHRVRGLVLVDPTIQRTFGFHVRRTLARFTSRRSWRNVLSGRSLRLRFAALASAPPTPPDYYELMVAEPREPTERARDMTARGVQFLYVLTGYALEYCNSPAQVREAMRGSFADNLRVEWRMDADHMLTHAIHREWLGERVIAWLPRVTVASTEVLRSRDRSVGSTGPLTGYPGSALGEAAGGKRG